MLPSYLFSFRPFFFSRRFVEAADNPPPQKKTLERKATKTILPDQQTDKKHGFCCLTIINTDKWLSVTCAVVLI